MIVGDTLVLGGRLGRSRLEKMQNPTMTVKPAESNPQHHLAGTMSTHRGAFCFSGTLERNGRRQVNGEAGRLNQLHEPRQVLPVWWCIRHRGAPNREGQWSRRAYLRDRPENRC